MSKNIFHKIADYAGKHKINLQFGQIEEPLLHKNLFYFLHLAKKAGVPHIHLTTNGTLLNSKNVEKLIFSGVNSVMFSLDASDPQTYQQIRGHNLSQLENKIKIFLPLAKKSNIQVSVSFILQPEALGERIHFLNKWQEIGVDKVCYYVLTEHVPKTGAIIRSEDLYDKGERYSCASPWQQSVVFPDGEVSLCCKTMLEVGWSGIISVGNLRSQSFEEIWVGPQYTHVRKELLENSFQTFTCCQDCQIWSSSSYIEVNEESYRRVYNETTETIIFSEK